MRLLLLITIVLRASTAFSQSPTVIDSLEQVLAKQSTKDSFRLNTLNALADRYDEVDIEKGHTYANEAIALANQLKLSDQLGMAYRNQGKLFYYESNYDSVMLYAEKARTTFRQTKNQAQEARMNFMLGRVLFDQGEYKKSNQYYENAVVIYKATGEKAKIGGIYNGIASNYLNLGDLSRANDYYYQSLTLAEEMKDSTALGLAICNIGFVYKNIGNLDKALGMYMQARTIFQLIDEKEYEASMWMKIGTIYDTKQETTKALAQYQAAYSINKEGNFSRGLAETMGNIGVTYLTMNKPDSALTYLHDALESFEANGDKKNQAVVLNKIGTALLSASPDALTALNIPVSSRLTAAQENVEKALLISIDLELPIQQFESHKTLTEVFKRMNNFKEALVHSEQAMKWQDSIFNDNKREEITKRELQYEYEKESAIVAARHEASLAQQRTTRNFLIGGAILVIIAGGIISWLYNRRRVLKAKQKEAELQTQIAETETKVLRLQMNPHFIFNSLNSISDYIVKNNSKEADEYLTQFSKVMRITLENSEHQFISLSDDLKMLEGYMKLEAKRLNNKFTYAIHIDDDIDTDNTLVPPMIFQPFIENSIWHGISKKATNGHIDIRLRQENEVLHCTIDDDGVGLKKQDNLPVEKDKQSMATRITKSRIDILNQLKGTTNGSVQLSDKPDASGVRAELTLPLELKF